MGDVTKVENHDPYIGWMIASQERLRQAISGALDDEAMDAEPLDATPMIGRRLEAALTCPGSVGRLRRRHAVGRLALEPAPRPSSRHAVA